MKNLLSLILLISLSLNIWLGFSSSSSEKGSKTNREETSLQTLYGKLNRCYENNRKLLSQLDSQETKQLKFYQPSPEFCLDKETKSSSQDTIFLSGINELAREYLFKSWENDKQGLLDFFYLLNDDEFKEDSFFQNLDSMSDSLGLSEFDRESLRPLFRDIYRQNIEKFISQLNSDPPDFRAMLDVVEGYYGQQDELIKNEYGIEALEAFLEDQKSKRAELVGWLNMFAEGSVE